MNKIQKNVFNTFWAIYVYQYKIQKCKDLINSRIVLEYIVLDKLRSVQKRYF